MIATLLAFSLLCVFENKTTSFSNLTGGTGTFRTFSAIPLESTHVGAQIYGNFFTLEPFIAGNKHTRSHFRISANFTYDIGVPVEFFSGTSFTFNENSTASTATSMTTFFENTDLGVRLGLPLSGDTFYIGSYGHIRLFSGTRAPRNNSGGLNSVSGPYMSGILGVSATHNLAKPGAKLPFRSHVNLGYRAPNTRNSGVGQDFDRFSLDAFKYSAIIGAISTELHYRYFIPFVEYSMEYAIMTGTDSAKFRDNRQKFSMGTRITPIPAVGVIIAGDIGINGIPTNSAVGIPRNPRYDIYAGLALQTLGRKLFDEVGSAQGLLTDDLTYLPLEGVVVRVSGQPTSFRSDSLGRYMVNDLKPGSYEISFQKDGYQTEKRQVRIREGTEQLIDISLKKAGPRAGQLNITVLDQETQQPLPNARVLAPTPSGNYVTDDFGQIRIPEINEGDQDITIQADGYDQQTVNVTIVPLQPTTQIVSLMKSPATHGECVGTVKNETAVPLTAVITTPSGQRFASDPITGEFRASLPLGSQNIKVQAENYMPQELECDSQVGGGAPLDVILKKPEEATLVDNKIVLPDAIYFEFNKADIREESFATLDQVVDVLSKNDSAYAIVNIDGHTDSVGSDDYNLKLSRRRADSVKTYLISKGIDGKRLEGRGFGEAKPVATNKTKEGQAENRRVEFNLVKDADK